MNTVELYTTKQAAERVKLHPETFGRLVRTGHGPSPTLLGGKRLFRADMLNSWIEASTAPQPAHQAAE